MLFINTSSLSYEARGGRLFADAGFRRVRATVVKGFAFRNPSTRDAAEEYGVKAVLFTALKPERS